MTCTLVGNGHSVCLYTDLSDYTLCSYSQTIASLRGIIPTQTFRVMRCAIISHIIMCMTSLHNGDRHCTYFLLIIRLFQYILVSPVSTFFSLCLHHRSTKATVLCLWLHFRLSICACGRAVSLMFCVQTVLGSGYRLIAIMGANRPCMLATVFRHL